MCRNLSSLWATLQQEAQTSATEKTAAQERLRRQSTKFLQATVPLHGSTAQHLGRGNMTPRAATI